MNSLAILEYGEIRVTEDERFSVFDTIRVIGGKKNPHETWKRLCDDYPEFLLKCQDFKFPGKGQRETPAATQDVLNEIIQLLPTIKKEVGGKTVYKRSEEYYRCKLHKKLGGVTEVCTPVGRIDILTSTEIIEVKDVKSWKSALGQIEVYSDYYPSHQKRLHLFGTCHSSFLELIKQHCEKRSIKVTSEA